MSPSVAPVWRQLQARRCRPFAALQAAIHRSSRWCADGYGWLVFGARNTAPRFHIDFSDSKCVRAAAVSSTRRVRCVYMVVRSPRTRAASVSTSHLRASSWSHCSARSSPVRAPYLPRKPSRSATTMNTTAQVGTPCDASCSITRTAGRVRRLARQRVPEVARPALEIECAVHRVTPQACTFHADRDRGARSRKRRTLAYRRAESSCLVHTMLVNRRATRS